MLKDQKMTFFWAERLCSIFYVLSVFYIKMAESVKAWFCLLRLPCTPSLKFQKDDYYAWCFSGSKNHSLSMACSSVCLAGFYISKWWKRTAYSSVRCTAAYYIGFNGPKDCTFWAMFLWVERRRDFHYARAVLGGVCNLPARAGFFLLLLLYTAACATLKYTSEDLCFSCSKNHLIFYVLSVCRCVDLLYIKTTNQLFMVLFAALACLLHRIQTTRVHCYVSLARKITYLYLEMVFLSWFGPGCRTCLPYRVQTVHEVHDVSRVWKTNSLFHKSLWLKALLEYLMFFFLSVLSISKHRS